MLCNNNIPIGNEISDSKEETRTRGSPSESRGLEFGKNMNLTAVEDPHSGSSKMSLIDLSHLDDSELNIMNSQEMLAVSKKLSDNSSRQISDSHSSGSSHHSEEDGSCVGRARPASVDDSVIDDSARVSCVRLLFIKVIASQLSSNLDPPIDRAGNAHERGADRRKRKLGCQQSRLRAFLHSSRSAPRPPQDGSWRTLTFAR
jgi:hypothetical protein